MLNDLKYIVIFFKRLPLKTTTTTTTATKRKEKEEKKRGRTKHVRSEDKTGVSNKI